MRTTENLSQDSRYPSRDSNRATADYFGSVSALVNCDGDIGVLRTHLPQGAAFRKPQTEQI
jgi:hypothetical protein